MEFRTLTIPDLVELRPAKRADQRGYFAEIFREDCFEAAIGPVRFVQENQSLNAAAGTLRGIHFQTNPYAQGKLVRCIAGRVFDVAVDLRHGSASYGRWLGIELSADDANQLWVPPGFGHGFCTLEADCIVGYRVSSYYSADHDRGVRWDDPAIGVAWPAVADLATLSAKDRVQPLLADLPAYFNSGDAVCA